MINCIWENDDENKTPVIRGTQDNGVWRFQFTVDKNQAGKAIPVVLGTQDGSWYSNQQLYLVVPEVKESEDQELPEAGVTVEQGGTAAAVNGFKVVSSSAKLSGDQVTVTFTVDGVTYDRIYLGKKDDSTKEPVVQGTQKDNQTTFTFKVSADQQESTCRSLRDVPTGMADKRKKSVYQNPECGKDIRCVNLSKWNL